MNIYRAHFSVRIEMFSRQLLLALIAFFIPAGHADLPAFESPLTSLSPTISVIIGTHEYLVPDQTVRGLFDTGSYNTWVIHKDSNILQPDKNGQYNAILFNSRASPSFEVTDDYIQNPYTAKFGAIEITGFRGYDSFKIGITDYMYGEAHLTIDKQYFCMAKKVPFAAVGKLFHNFEAYVGWDLQIPAPQGTEKSVPESIREQYGAVPVLSYYFTGNIDQPGKLIFNADDKAYYEGKLNTHKVISTDGSTYNGWNVNFVKVTIGDKTIYSPGGKPARIITRMDPILIGPKSFIDEINKAIFKDAVFFYESDFSFSCRPNDPVKDNKLKLAKSVKITIDSVDYEFNVDEYIKLFYRAQKCKSFFVSSGDQVIIGMGFLNTYYTRFDYDNRSVEIAKMKKEPPRQVTIPDDNLQKENDDFDV